MELNKQMPKFETIENEETSTAGISSAMQLVSSTSALSISLGTAPLPMVLLPIEERPEEKRVETFKDTLQRIIRMHKQALDKLDEH